MAKYLLKNISVYDDDSFYTTSILIENGVVLEIGEISSAFDIEIDGSQKDICLIPGFFDLSMRLSGLDHTSEVKLDGQVDKIVKSGITSALLMPDVSPNIDSIQIVNDIRRRLENVNVTFYPVASIIKQDGDVNKISEMFSLSDEGVIAFSDINNPITDNEFLYNSFNYASMINKKIIKVVQEDGFDNAMVNDGKVSDKWGLRGDLDISESVSAFKTISVAKKLKNYLHLSTVTTKVAVDVIKKFKNGEYDFSVGTTPLYFSLTEDVLLNNLTPKYKVYPPLRSEEDRKTIIESLRDGLIDVITSGHKLNSVGTKNLDFQGASFGSATAYTYFPSISEYLYHQNGFSKEKIVELISINPRKLFNIEIPKVKIGMPLEHVLVDFDKEFMLSSEEMPEKLNVFINRALKGSILNVFSKNRDFQC